MWCKIFVYYADIVIFVLERFNLARLVCSASASRSPDSFLCRSSNFNDANDGDGRCDMNVVYTPCLRKNSQNCFCHNLSLIHISEPTRPY